METSRSTQRDRIFCFGPFELSERSGELRKNGVRVKLQEQPFRVLAELVTNAGRIVTREELQQKLWPADTFVDFDVGLNSVIRKLRQTLNDDADEPRYIKTLAKRGYRFVEPVTDTAAKGSELRSQPVSDAALTVEGVPEGKGEAVTRAKTVAQHGPTETVAQISRNQFVPWVLAGLAILAILTVLTVVNVSSLRKRIRGNATTPPAIQSLAVLPLENLSRDPEQEYFADGMTEELTTELAQISSLKVISHTSVVQYKGTKRSLPQIARELGVDAVVEGAVKRSGDKVGITVQLIHAPSDQHLWAKSYQRDLRDVLDLQREVTHAIVGEIQAKLTVPEKARLASAQSVDSQAHEDYLKGRFSMEKGELKKSIAYFQRAIQQDPNYALAYAGLANAYISRGQPWFGEGDMRPADVFPQAEAAARKALQIDPSLGEGHLALARVIQLYDWDWPSVEKEYRRALELNPNDAWALNFFGEYLQQMGRNEEALEKHRRAVALNPLDSLTAGAVASDFYTARQYDAAIQALQQVLESDRDFDPHVMLGWVYEQKKMYPEAIAELQKAVDLSNRHEVTLASLGQVLGESGRKQEATKILEELQRRSQQRYVSPCLVALVQIGLGQRDQAIASLEQGYANRDQWMLYLKVDPHMDELRSDPRFQDLLRRIAIPA
jgi:TolB-like protein/DNA-binding winged helix-turn-helix (wHTH) protein/Tfp pilus assembly protein PilF